MRLRNYIATNPTHFENDVEAAFFKKYEAWHGYLNAVLFGQQDIQVSIIHQATNVDWNEDVKRDIRYIE
jgi:hypothetical protein